MADYNLINKNLIKNKQLRFLTKEAVMDFDIDTENEISFNQYAQDLLKNFYEIDTVEPLFNPIPYVAYQLPWKEDVLKNFREIHADLTILNEEQNNLGQILVDNFNFVESEKKRLFNRIDTLRNLTGDLSLISNENNGNIVYIKDSFQSVDLMDDVFSASSIQKVSLMTNEGIITLGESKSFDLTNNTRVAEINGNGEAGTKQLVRKLLGNDYSTNEEIETYVYLSSFGDNYHEDPMAIVDGRPDTIFEYQMVNVPESFKNARRRYDFEWANGKEKNDKLTLRLVFDLGKLTPINWISIIPYFAYRSNGRIIVRSIKLSEDGFEYTSIYKEKELLHQELADAQSTKEINDLFNGNTSPADASYSGKGVWLFSQRQARYVEIVIDQDQSYNELIGQSVYYITSEDNDKERVYIPAPVELKDAAPGKYARNGSYDYIFNKEINVTEEGWRYAIGLRDIHFMKYNYTPKSLYVSKKYEIEGKIKRVTLYANEIIPQEYQDVVSKMNDWVQYEISFDDLTWYRISPMHHEPVNNEFPPKIIEINGKTLNEDMSFELYKQYIGMDKYPKQIRFRIILSRPEESQFEFTTPIVHDVALKIEKEEERI